MIKNLTIKNFKSLKEFEIKRLGQVNLIVGKNNSGKSTVLESIRILASKGNPSTINEIITSHDDQVLMQNRGPNDEEDSIQFYEGLFSERKFPLDGSAIFIGDRERSEFVEVKRVYYEESEVETKDDKGNVSISRIRKVYDIGEVPRSHEYEQIIQVTTNQNIDRPFFLTYSDRNSYRRRSFSIPEFIRSTPISYIPTQFLSMDLLANLWDRTVLTDYFENVRSFLKVISEDLEDVAFIKVNSQRSSREVERTGIVKLRNHEKPIPLNSMGDGVLRILQLVLGILPAAGGILLIDEFENGLHYSVQEKVWELIFQLSKELNIQVFTTTHSWDCIEAFTVASKLYEVDAQLCRIGRSAIASDNGKTVSTLIDKESLATLTQSDVELR